MTAMFNGKPLFGPRGPAGPDGNPIGTIISYMGLTAPKDYLICDGKEYNIADYPKLAEFFKEQFGSNNYFGGDGTTTFAVPDMRNLFLRGFHGEASEQLSGDVGAKQEATEIPVIERGTSGNDNNLILVLSGVNPVDAIYITNADSYPLNKATYRRSIVPSGSIPTNALRPMTYTSRPVNMAVLYCIKAIVEETYENVYSTEETRVGTWIDGKPVYRKVIKGVSKNGEVLANDVAEIITDYGWFTFNNIRYEIPFYGATTNYIWAILNGTDAVLHVDGASIGNPFVLVLEYTKTTD